MEAQGFGRPQLVEPEQGFEVSQIDFGQAREDAGQAAVEPLVGRFGHKLREPLRQPALGVDVGPEMRQLVDDGDVVGDRRDDDLAPSFVTTGDAFVTQDGLASGLAADCRPSL